MKKYVIELNVDEDTKEKYDFDTFVKMKPKGQNTNNNSGLFNSINNL